MQGAGRTGISPALGVTLPKARRRHAGGRLSDSHPRGAQLCPRGRVPAFVICQPAFCFRVRVDPEVNGRPVQTGLGPSATLRPPPCSPVNSLPVDFGALASSRDLCFPVKIALLGEFAKHR